MIHKHAYKQTKEYTRTQGHRDSDIQIYIQRNQVAVEMTHTHTHTHTRIKIRNVDTKKTEGQEQNE